MRTLINYGLIFFAMAGMACHQLNTRVAKKSQIFIQTYPPGVAILAHDSLIGYTPLKIAKGQNAFRSTPLRFSLEGYYDDSVLLHGRKTIYRELTPICTTLHRQDIRCRRDYLIWQETFQLKWDHFEGVVPKEKQSKNADVTVSAFTNSGLSVYHRFVHDSLYVYVYSFFNRRASWSKEKQMTEKGIRLLAHEQGHFNISEVYARKLRKDILDRPFTSMDTLTVIAELDLRIEAIGRSCKKAQLDYDEYTYNHLYQHYQTYWDEMIANSLKEMEAYKAPLTSISIRKN
jgi:hypothetical protein